MREAGCQIFSPGRMHQAVWVIFMRMEHCRFWPAAMFGVMPTYSSLLIFASLKKKVLLLFPSSFPFFAFFGEFMNIYQRVKNAVSEQEGSSILCLCYNVMHYALLIYRSSYLNTLYSSFCEALINSRGQFLIPS